MPVTLLILIGNYCRFPGRRLFPCRELASAPRRIVRGKGLGYGLVDAISPTTIVLDDFVSEFCHAIASLGRMSCNLARERCTSIRPCSAMHSPWNHYAYAQGLR